MNQSFAEKTLWSIAYQFIALSNKLNRNSNLFI